MIHNYDDFVKALLTAGFSMGGGGSDEGIYAVVPWGWQEAPPYETPVRWHTGDPKTDPWEWRMRVLDERDDIAYGKFFFKKTGFITRAWYPYFLAARRGGTSFEEAYEDGTISHFAKRIYEAVVSYGTLPLHAIKELAGFSKEDKSGFDRALVELQMRMFLTMCGRQQKMSQKGEEYGWSSTVFCTTERFFGDDVFKEAVQITAEVAFEKISAQVLKLNPSAPEKKIAKFIRG
ncbi:MAG: hypothetical protein FWC76_02955 [Defluviitaleaceae bacterium]|nr:hypothetical protein [Defluviitaleaceae bacterium]